MASRLPAAALLALAILAIATVACRDRRGDESTASATSEATSTDGPPVDRPDPGASRGSMRLDGYTRGWRLYVPASLPEAGFVPLVIGLHGGLGSGEQFAADARFDEQAERGAFIAVYPDGVARSGLIDARTWNAGSCCGTAVSEGVDDVAFIEALLDRLVGELPLDEDRVYVTGHSNGAMMGYRLACELSDRIAAIAVVAGSLEAPCAPSEPVSILSIHGDADESHPLEGGNGPRAITNVDYNSVASSIASWRDLDGCPGEPVVTEVGPVHAETWSRCAENTEVGSIVVAGASHSWPGGAPTGPLRADPSSDLDASAAVWDFLSRQRR
jgi:polyhydroxybutyrate depolymerase